MIHSSGFYLLAIWYKKQLFFSDALSNHHKARLSAAPVSQREKDLFNEVLSSKRYTVLHERVLADLYRNHCKALGTKWTQAR